MTRPPIFEADRYYCPNCGIVNDVIVEYDRGQVVCRKCGTVIKENVTDLGPEWRKPESARAYSGPFGSTVGNIERGAVKLSDKLKAITLRKFTKPISMAAERIEIDLREFLESARDKLNIPKPLMEEAVALYKKLYDAGFRVTQIEAYAAVLYFVLKKHGSAVATLRAFSERLGVERHALVSAYMELLNVASNLGIRPPRTDPRIYIPRIVSSLGIRDEKSAEVQRVAVDILRYISALRSVRNGRKPQVLAAAAVYYACYIAGIEVTQKDLAKAADSTEGPVRELLRELARRLYVEITI
ncbi:MAG: TFIIB-type zinc ribbon-containing protein [Pyrobaculum sp.]